MTERDDTPPDPHADRLSRARERMSMDYDDPPPSRRETKRKWWELGPALAGDPTTRRLTYGAFGLGALLVLGVGGWTLFGHHQSGIPVIGPPPEPIRDKPADPGGMELDGAMAPADVPAGAARLAPGPEQPDPAALAARYGGKAKEDAGEADSAPAPAAAGDAAAPAQGKEDTGSATPAAPEAAPASEKAPKAEPAPVREATLPPPVPVTKKTASAEADTPAAPKVPEAPVAAATGPYGVQLAAVDSEASAHKEWERVTAISPQLFAGHSPLIEKVVHSNAIFYRLRMRGFDSVAAAQAFCVKIREHGHACNPLRP